MFLPVFILREGLVQKDTITDRKHSVATDYCLDLQLTNVKWGDGGSVLWSVELTL